MLRYLLSGGTASGAIVVSQITIPDPGKVAVDAAAAHGWESAVLAVIVLGSFAVIGKLVRDSFARHDRQVDRTLDESAAREKSLRERVTHLETMLGQIQAEQTKSLASLLSNVNVALTRLTTVMESRPCVLAGAGTIKVTPPPEVEQAFRQSVSVS